MVKIIDNFINKDLYIQLKNIFLGDNFPWFLKKGTVDSQKNDLYWFSHSIYNDFKPNSDMFSFMHEFIKKLNMSSLIQIRINLSLATNKDFKTLWHTDYNYKNHKTAIFYFNSDTTGTVFKIKEKEKLVKAKENRIVVFDGDTQHCAYLNNKIDRRIVINFNYYEKN